MEMDIQQQKAVESKHPTILCPAGPGSGKTKVLVARIIRLLVEDKVPPSRIVAVTFTNAGAKEIQKRLADHLYFHSLDSSQPGAPLGFCGTLHSWMLRLLQKHGELVKLPLPVTVMSEQAAEELLLQCAKDLRVDCTTKSLKEAVSLTWSITIGEFRNNKPLLVANEYFTRQRQSGELDFDNLLYYGLKLIQENPQVVEGYDFLFADEYQDSAPIDAKIYAACHPIVHKFFVGDPDQNIYSFRGTTVTNMLKLAAGEDVASFPLTTNYRSCTGIVEASQRLIQHNAARISNVIVPRPGAGPGVVEVFCGENAAAELGFITSQIQRLVADPSVAVLFRSNQLANQARDYLMSLGVRVAERAAAVLDSPECGVGRAAVAVMANPYSDRAALHFTGLACGKEQCQALQKKADATLTTPSSLLSPQIGTWEGEFTLGRFTMLLHQHKFLTGDALGWVILLASKLPSPFTMGDLLIAANRRDTDEEPTTAGVHIGTVHSVKGREWEHVFMAGAEAEVWPGRDTLEEARRLFYVGITRAKSRLCISWARSRQNPFATYQTQPRTKCQFIEEMGL